MKNRRINIQIVSLRIMYTTQILEDQEILLPAHGILECQLQVQKKELQTYFLRHMIIRLIGLYTSKEHIEDLI